MSKTSFALVVLLAIAPYGVRATDDFYPGDGRFPLASRNALVIGVAEVQPGIGFGRLRNPLNDATRISTALRNIGFNVLAPHELVDGPITRQTIKRALYDFALLLQNRGGVGLIYYSGHGLERDAQSYLVPYDAFLKYRRDLDEELIPISLLLDAFVFAKNGLNILVLDSCRNFPFKGNFEVFGIATDRAERKDKSSLVLMTSTLSGFTAEDGKGDLSPYAEAFISALAVPELTLSEFVGNIADGLARKRIEEVPSFSSRGSPEFIFRPTINSFNREKQIYSSGDRFLLRQLTTKHAGGYFAKAAKEALESAPLAIPPVAAVTVNSEAALRDLPSSSAEIVAKPARGTILRVLEGAPERAGWLRVASPGGNETVFVEASKTRSTRTSSTEIPLSFAAISVAGVDALSDASRGQLVSALLKGNREVVRVEVVGYSPTDVSTGAPSQRLLARQAVVAAALQESGIKPELIATSVMTSPGALTSGEVAIRVVSTLP